ncbi:MAG: amidophosphoribosyltransferase [Lachnospiraceae bacterium]|nr:amidophosphoribosyltransferase [Lachnospiraceae bacterium]
MGGFFGAISKKEDVVFDVFFGTDYHSHLGTRRAGMVFYDDERGFDRAIHNIENSPFRTKFDRDMNSMKGRMGLGCISDYEPQPVNVRSRHGSYSIVTVGKINNEEEILNQIINNGNTHFMEMSGGLINQTELVAAIINSKKNLIEGIQYAQEIIDGSMTFALMTPDGIYVARDKMGRTPVSVGHKDGSWCFAFENYSYLNLGYKNFRELGPGEVVIFTEDGPKTLVNPGSKMKICTFLWIYYGYPSASYEGISVERMRYNCGEYLAKRDDVKADLVAGVPDSGTAHAVGYSMKSEIPFQRPFIKYTPTWPRSFMPTTQNKRDMIAKMKILPVEDLIKDKSMVIIDDSIVRGTQLRETTEYLFANGASEVHVRPACPPIMFGCKYLNFSRSKSDMDLIARRVICELNPGQTDIDLTPYCDPDTKEYQQMVDKICEQMGFTSLRYHRLDDMLASVEIDPDKLCTYCWDGRE